MTTIYCVIDAKVRDSLESLGVAVLMGYLHAGEDAFALSRNLYRNGTCRGAKTGQKR